MCTGLLLLRYVYSKDWIHGVISSLVTYLICLISPRKHVHLYVFVWAMGYMTFSHLYRMVFFYMVDQFDFTRTQMVLTMKLTSFAFNLYDGSCQNSNVSNNCDNEVDNISNNSNDIKNGEHEKNGINGKNCVVSNGKNMTEENNNNIHKNGISKENTKVSTNLDAYNKKVTMERTQYAIVQLPSPLEFGGFVFCFPNLLAGPAFAYKDYIDGIVGELNRGGNYKINY